MMGSICRQLVGRMVGELPITVKQAGDTIAIGYNSDGSKVAAVDRVLAEITSETGSGVYEWSKVRGAGPLTGSATEIDSTTGISTGTKAWLFRQRGSWWFQNVAAADSKTCSIVYSGTSSVGTRTSLALYAFEWDVGGFNNSGAKIPEDGKYLVIARVDFTIRASITTDPFTQIVVVLGGGDNALYSGTPMTYLVWVNTMLSDITGANPGIATASKILNCTAGQTIALDVGAMGSEKACVGVSNGYLWLEKVG